MLVYRYQIALVSFWGCFYFSTGFRHTLSSDDSDFVHSALQGSGRAATTPASQGANRATVESAHRETVANTVLREPSTAAKDGLGPNKADSKDYAAGFMEMSFLEAKATEFSSQILTDAKSIIYSRPESHTLRQVFFGIAVVASIVFTAITLCAPQTNVQEEYDAPPEVQPQVFQNAKGKFPLAAPLISAEALKASIAKQKSSGGTRKPSSGSSGSTQASCSDHYITSGTDNPQEQRSLHHHTAGEGLIYDSDDSSTSEEGGY